MSRAIVFSNGTYADLAAIGQRLQPDDFLICADGALSKLVELGLWPHLLVGDFDSVDEKLLQQAKERQVELLTFQQEKDYTDTDLAFQEGITRGYRQFLIVGAWGGRIDHSLANLLSLPPYVQQGLQIVVSDGETDAHIVCDHLMLQGCRDKLVSIIPLTPEAEGVTIRGFYYPLRKEKLAWGRLRGISNVAIADEASVSVDTGVLLVTVMPQEHPA